MSDKEFLEWLGDRLVHVYGESQFTDFVRKLRAVAAVTPENQSTDWT